MLDRRLPDLTFPNFRYGQQEVPRDLRRWIYRYGAATDIRMVFAQIQAGKLGSPLQDRFELVRKIHEVLLNNFERGGSQHTLRGQIDKLNVFFQWIDEVDIDLTLETAEDKYRQWSDSLLHRVRVEHEISEGSAYEYGNVVGGVIDRVLGRSVPLIKTTRLHKPKNGRRVVGIKADRQNLEHTFVFGNLLLDLADGLSAEVIFGSLPVRIRVRNGKALEEWSGLKRSDTLRPPNPKYPRQAARYAQIADIKRREWEADTTFRTRYPLINLRILAELFMLIGQSGINLAQAQQLRMDQWRYKPSSNGYEVRTYKHRRWGPVVFEIYSQYRVVFERYLRWREVVFPHDPDGLLFPLLDRKGFPSTRYMTNAPSFGMLQSACDRAGVKYLPPSDLRNTNVNWMLRRTQDPSLTAEEKQHSTKTLIGVYEKPSLQRAMVQIKGFWAKHDPAQVAVGPGACLGKLPQSISERPAVATQPDCLTPAGCLFCVHQRDIDSIDHIWSLASFRLLKSFELRAQGKPKSNSVTPEHPAEAAIERITAKLSYISASSAQRHEWVQESLLRIEEGRYHPAWAEMIEGS